MIKRLLVFLLMVGVSSASMSAAVTVATLRCEYLTNPLGLDVAKPRFSWILQSNDRNEGQSAYQVVVASSPEVLGKDQGDLWDSGKIASGETTQIEYQGSALSSRQPCWWKVRAWDKSGTASAWSEAAHWEMGLLQPDDWQAKWIQAAPMAGDHVSQGKISILQAFFEATDGGGSKDVTGIVTALLNDNHLDVLVNNDAFGGDPAYGHVKRLRVSYTLDGVKHEASAGEDSTLSLPENLQVASLSPQGF